MKKYALLLLSTILLFTSGREACAKSPTEALPDIECHIDYVQQKSISLGMTTNQCKLSAIGDADVTSITANLSVYKLQNGNFTLIKSWTGNGKRSIHMSKAYSTSGGAYKLVATVTSTSKNGAQETVTKTQYFNL